MAILRSTDGKFYEIPDGQLADKLIPGDELKAKLDSAAELDTAGVGGEITANSHRWRNFFRNHWRRNCWRNHF